MNLFEKIVTHFQGMNALEGDGSDYPVMLCIYLGVFLFSFIANLFLFVSNHGNRIVWLPDQHKVIKSKFSYMAMLACTFTGVYLVGSFPSELHNTYGTWNADLFYTLGQTTIMITAGIYSLATFKRRSSVILNSLSIIVGLSTSIPMAATTIMLPLDIDSNVIQLSAIVTIIVAFVVLAALSVKYDLLVKYSRINIYLFIITTIALFTTINTYSTEGVDTSKILPFQGMISGEPWLELLTNPYWWYFEATVVSWAASDVYKRQTLSFSRGWVIYVLTALTMFAFAVTSLDSASKTLLNDITRISQSRNLKYKPSLFLKCIMVSIGLINVMILYTGSSKLFTILFCLIFIPFLSKAILYSIKFALGKVDFSKSGTITEGEYVRICGEVPKEEDMEELSKL